MNDNVDIAIVGGGIVGASLALHLAEISDLSIALIEAKANGAPFSQENYYPRVSAITLTSKRIFVRTGVWEAIADARVSPFVEIKVWDKDEKGKVSFCSRDIAESVLGYIVENNLIQESLYNKIKDHSQIIVLQPKELIDFKAHEESVELTMRDGSQLHARLCVAADGANSWVREKAGISLKKHDYEELAIVAMVKSSLPHGEIARQVFLKTGPLAFLPLADPKLTSIVWSLPKEEAQSLMALADDDFNKALNHAFAELGDIEVCSKRFTFPLIKQEASHYVKARVALVGDAAHTVHPLAGLGFNMGLLDVVNLSFVINEAALNGRDFAALPILRRYERERRADNLAYIQGIDMIKKILTNDKNPFPMLRAFGLNVTNRIPFLRNFFTRFATGSFHRLPPSFTENAHE